jgi:hypothetical protein
LQYFLMKVVLPVKASPTTIIFSGGLLLPGEVAGRTNPAGLAGSELESLSVEVWGSRGGGGLATAASEEALVSSGGAGGGATTEASEVEEREADGGDEGAGPGCTAAAADASGSLMGDLRC